MDDVAHPVRYGHAFGSGSFSDLVLHSLTDSEGHDLALLDSHIENDRNTLVGCCLALAGGVPSDRAGEVQAKVSDWLTAGSHLVWVIDPGRRRAIAYRGDGSVDLLTEHDSLDGENVLRGFSCALAEVL